MAGIDGFGTQWSVADATGLVFTAVAEVVSIDILDVSVEDIDVTSHDSTGQWAEFLGGIKDGGALSMEVNFDPSLHADLMDLLGVERNQKITLPVDASSAEITFAGYINGIAGAAPYDDKLSATVTLKVTGAVTVPTS